MSPDDSADRLHDISIDVLSENEEVVSTKDYSQTVGESATVAFDDGSVGRFVRIRFQAERKDYLTLAEVVVTGFVM